MPTTDKIEIPIEATDNATGTFDEVTSSAQNMGSEIASGASSAAFSLTDLKSGIDLVVGAFTQAYQVAKQAYEFIGEGADLQLAEVRFNRLAQSIGTTSEALNTDLKRATGGMLSQAEQMQLAGDLMSLGLAKTHDEAVRLTGVASQLGMDMNQLVLTLTNQTTMRFDSLGLAVDGFDDKVKKLEDTGMSADEAFKWAFIEQAEAQIERIGSVADTTAGKLMMLEASAKDASDGLKRSALEMVSPLIDAMAAEEQLKQAAEAGIITREKSTELINKATWTSYTFAEALSYVADEEARLAENQERLNSEAADADAVMLSYASSAEYAAESTGAIADSVSSAGDMMDFYGARAQEAANRTKYVGDQMRRAAQDANIAGSSIDDMLEGINVNIDSPVKAFIADMEWFLATGGKFEEAFEKIKNADITPEQKLDFAKDLLDDIEQAQDAIASGDDDSLTGALEDLDQMSFEIDDLQTVKDETQDILSNLRQLSSTKWAIEVEMKTLSQEGGGPGGDLGGGSGDTSGGWDPPDPGGMVALPQGIVIQVNGAVAWEMEKRTMRRSDRARLESVM